LTGPACPLADAGFCPAPGFSQPFSPRCLGNGEAVYRGVLPNTVEASAALNSWLRL
jgi:hypothetical protein